MYPGLLENYGFNVCLAGPTEIVQDHYNNEYNVDFTFSDVVITDFVAIMILGGSTDYPSNLGDISEAMDIVKDAYSEGLVIFAHDEGPVALAAADIISGRNITCTFEVLADVVAAGANFIDEPLVIDGQFVTTRDYSGGSQAATGIITALGLVEEDPPILDSFEVEVLDNRTPGSILISAAASDVFGIDYLKVQLFRYNETTSTFEFLKEQQMTCNPEKTVFTSNIYSLTKGNYTINIIATDVFGNSIAYIDLFRFIIEESNTNAIKQVSLDSLVIIFSSLYLIIKNILKTKLRKKSVTKLQ